MDVYIVFGVFGAILWFLFLTCSLFIVFCTICILCEQHLVPAIEIVIDVFKIPEEVAAVTVVALGSAMPEIVFNTIGAVQHQASLSLPSSLGSGIVAFGLIPPLCVLLNEDSELYLKTWPIIREALCYSTAFGLFLRAFSNGSVSSFEALCLVSVYICYVFVVIMLYIYSSEQPVVLGPAIESFDQLDSHNDLSMMNTEGEPLILESNSHDIEQIGNIELHELPNTLMNIQVDLSPSHSLSISTDQSSSLSEFGSTVQLLTASKAGARSEERSAGVVDQSSKSSLTCIVDVLSPLLNVLCYYIGSVLKVLMPQVRGGVLGCQASPSLRRCDSLEKMSPRARRLRHVNTESSLGSLGSSLSPPKPNIYRVCAVLIACVSVIAVCASCVLVLCSTLTSLLGLENGTVGATLMAFGSEVPDAISSITLARNGFHEAAIAGAIGSQVINLSFGVGLPLFVFLLLDGDTEELVLESESTNSLWLLSGLLFIVIFCHVFCICWKTFKSCCCSCCSMRENRSVNCFCLSFDKVRDVEFHRAPAYVLLAISAVCFPVFIVLNEYL